MTWSLYRLRVKHDEGYVTFDVPATDEESAARVVMACELCPRQAIKSIRLIKVIVP